MRICLLIFLTFKGVELLAVDITEKLHQGRPHFVVETKLATYYYDKNGGGFSSILDKNDIDWIDYSEISAKAAENSFDVRGLPNMIILANGDMTGGPDNNYCQSKQSNKRTIVTETRDGKWKWEWTFYKRYAKLSIIKSDPSANYWFLYHGLIAGRFNPEKQYWGTNLGGPRKEFNKYLKGERIFSNWRWVYFGDYEEKRVFYVAMEQADRNLDTFSYKNYSNVSPSDKAGMVIFGFGRMEDEKPLIQNEDNTFYIGFVEQRVTKSKHHLKVQKIIEGIL